MTSRVPVLLLACAAAASAAAPVITELQPRGAQTGRTFTLTVLGRDIPEGARIVSAMPAAFTPLVAGANAPPVMMGMSRAQFLVEPAANLGPGTYPLRLESPAGISNVLFFSVGTFPELTEEESAPYSRPNRNDNIETAEPVQQTPVTVNGTLRGAERDVYRIYAKAGERRVLEVEARRCGSAIDPVLRILDGSGRQLARSEDAPGAGLDARLDFTFPREASYYVEVHDARFSRQGQNFYRLKMGAFQYADGIFPLGGRRGTETEVEFFGGNLPTPVRARIDLRSLPEHAALHTAALPGSSGPPVPFAVGDLPEILEGSAAPSVPGVINGRLAKAGEIDRYKLAVEPGDKLIFELQARELGTSKLEGIIAVWDQSGRKLDSAGDKPLPEDVFAVQGTSRTSTDPFLNFTVPPDTREITLTVEDLALRGGPHYGYRLIVRRAAEDFLLSLATPYINVPAGGTAIVVAVADRRGYNGPIQLSIPDLPRGIRAEGGVIPREYVDVNNARTFNRRGVLILSADPGVEMPVRELTVWGEARLDSGETLRRRARGPGTAVEVAGATAQGVVDRQRSLTAPWLAVQLPAATTLPQSAALEVRQVKVTRMDEGDRYDFEYTWTTRAAGLELPEELSVDPVGARDIRVTDFQKSGKSGSFSISTTKATDPASYDIIVRGRVKHDGLEEDIYARPLPLVVTERSANAQVSAAR